MRRCRGGMKSADEVCRTLAGAMLGLALLPGTAVAEEGGSGHYMPGSMASFIDGAPPKETFMARLNVLDYSGSLNQPLPIAQLDAADAEVDSSGYALTLVWRPPIELGDRWSYSMSTTIPYITMDVTADVKTNLPNGTPVRVQRSDSSSGLGDIVLIPLLLNYNFSPDFNMNYRVTFYAPSGDYEVGRLANTGKNFWTVEPTVAFMYLGQKNGIEASLFVGADFNEENPDTDYKSGTQFHLDGTLAQHFPFAGGLAGVGVSAYYYKQIDGDSGDGATFGDFEAKTTGSASCHSSRCSRCDPAPGHWRWFAATRCSASSTS